MYTEENTGSSSTSNKSHIYPSRYSYRNLNSVSIKILNNPFIQCARKPNSYIERFGLRAMNLQTVTMTQLKQNNMKVKFHPFQEKGNKPTSAGEAYI